MIRTLELHLGLISAVLVALAARSKKTRLLCALLPIALGFGVVPLVSSFVPKAPPAVTGDTIKLLTLNLMYVNREVEPVFEAVMAAEADVVLFQEYSPHWHRAFQFALAATYPFFSGKPLPSPNGVAIYSRLPFLGTEERVFYMEGSGQPHVRAVVNVGGREVSIYNMYLLGPHFFGALDVRRKQFGDLLELLLGDLRPVIVAGDFNLTNSSPQARELRRLDLTDVCDQVGGGPGNTWPYAGAL